MSFTVPHGVEVDELGPVETLEVPSNQTCRTNIMYLCGHIDNIPVWEDRTKLKQQLSLLARQFCRHCTEAGNKKK